MNTKTTNEQLDEDIEEVMEMTKDYNTLGHLLSDNDGIAAMAKVRQLTGRIQQNLKISKLKDFSWDEELPLQKTGRRVGSLVRVSPCAEKFEGKTFIGYYVGDVATSVSVGVDEDKISINYSRRNPAILIPEVGEIVYGMESWWGEIKSEEDLKDIDPESVWYVKALKELQALKEKEDVGN